MHPTSIPPAPEPPHVSTLDPHEHSVPQMRMGLCGHCGRPGPLRVNDAGNLVVCPEDGQLKTPLSELDRPGA